MLSNRSVDNIWEKKADSEHKHIEVSELWAKLMKKSVHLSSVHHPSMVCCYLSHKLRRMKTNPGKVRCIVNKICSLCLIWRNQISLTDVSAADSKASLQQLLSATAGVTLCSQPPAAHGGVSLRPSPWHTRVFRPLIVISGFSIFSSLARDELIFSCCYLALSSFVSQMSEYFLFLSFFFFSIPTSHFLS